MKRLRKLPKTWVFIAHPCGYDPYNSYDSSYMANSETVDLRKLRTEVADQYLTVLKSEEELALAGIYQHSKPTVKPFSLDDPLL